MAFWSSWFNKGGPTRKEGYQNSSPNKSLAAYDSVSFESAMTLSAFWASTKLLTETVAAMPIKCYEINQETNVKKPKINYDLFNLINRKPNRYQTRTEFFEGIMLGLVIDGNAFVKIDRAGGRIISLTPLVSSQMNVFLNTDGSLSYKYDNANGKPEEYGEDRIWHIKIFGNGLVGLSPLGYAASTVQTAQDLESRAETLAANGGKTTGILTVDDQKLNPDQRKQIKKAYANLESGDKEDGLFVLESNMKYQQTALSPADVQLLESRRFSVEDIARFMGVPSSLINDTAATTTWGSGIQQINMGFYKLNLRPYLERIESSLKRWLMSENDWETVEIEFDFDALLRADKETRITANSTAINSGQLTPNEARATEGKDTAKGGDYIYLNGSLVPAGQEKEGINNEQ